MCHFSTTPNFIKLSPNLFIPLEIICDNEITSINFLWTEKSPRRRTENVCTYVRRWQFQNNSQRKLTSIADKSFILRCETHSIILDLQRSSICKKVPRQKMFFESLGNEGTRRPRYCRWFGDVISSFRPSNVLNYFWSRNFGKLWFRYFLLFAEAKV